MFYVFIEQAWIEWIIGRDKMSRMDMNTKPGVLAEII